MRSPRRRRRIRRTTSLCAALAFSLLGCSTGQTPPTITVEWLDGSSWLELTDYLLLPSQDQSPVTFRLRIGGQAAGGISVFRCTQDGEEVALDFAKGREGWSAEYDFTLAQPFGEIEIRLIDRRLARSVRTVGVYLSPAVIDGIYLAGTSADQIQVHWVSEPLYMAVALAQGLPGTYTVSVTQQQWDGSSYGPAEPVAMAQESTFPATPGRYLYSVTAADAGTPYGQTLQFPVYVNDVSVANDWGLAAPGEDTHAAAGKNLTFVWGELDTAVGAGLWVVEVRSLTLTRSVRSGASAALPFDDIGPYGVRIGVRALAVEGSPYVYTRDRSTGYVGTNRPPDAPTVTGTTLDVSAALGGTFVLTLSATDPDGDEPSYIIEYVSLGGLSIIYDPVTKTSSWSYTETEVLPEVPGTLGSAGPGQLLWQVTPGTFSGPRSFTMSFSAVDRFGDRSPETPVTFTVN